MKDEIKEIYLSSLKWTKTHDNMGGVIGNVVFKDNISYEEYNKLFKSGYFILCDKDYITNLQEELEDLRESDWAWHQTLKIQNKREYRSKFLKEFQEEYGTNTFPDYDEIYKRYDKMKKENEKLKNGYCDLKVKCNNGECDCTNEEYEGMVEANMKLSLKYDKALELLQDFNMPCECCDCKIPDEYCEEYCSDDSECYKKCWNKYIELVLQGEDKDE